jgi:hypothetical protein
LDSRENSLRDLDWPFAKAEDERSFRVDRFENLHASLDTHTAAREATQAAAEGRANFSVL